MLLVASAILLSYTAWNYIGTTAVAQHKQEEISDELRTQWEKEPDQATSQSVEPAKPAPATEPDQNETSSNAFALVRIPRFGDSYEVPLVRGTDAAALSSGIGWDTGSATPGNVGNVVIAGHRITHGEPFRKFPKLKAGDEVFIETGSAIYTYELQMDGDEWVVDDSQTWVTNPVPGEARDSEPGEHLLTLITCTDLYASNRRSIATAILTHTESK